MRTEQNTNDYMNLTYGFGWRSDIVEPNDNERFNEIFIALFDEFSGNEDWDETTCSELFWVGEIELNGTKFYIGGEDEMCDVFLVAQN